MKGKGTTTSFKSKPHELRVMDKMLVARSFFWMYIGVWGFLMLAFTLAENDSTLYLNLWGNVEVFIAASIIPIFMISFGLLRLRKNAVEFKIPTSVSGKIKLIPMIAGFALMSVGVGLAALNTPEFLPDGTVLQTSLHPFVIQGLGLFFAGTLIQLLELVWYYDSATSEPAQIKPPDLVR